MKNVFLHIPKTAGNSIRQSLNKLEVEYLDLGHSNFKNQGISTESTFSFCFVRNPFARLRSAFYHLVEVDIDKALSSESPFANRRALLKKTYGADYEKFVLDRGFEKFNFSHFYPQTNWVYGNGKRLINFVGYLEDIDYDFSLLSSKLFAKSIPLDKVNSTKAKIYESKEFLSDDALRLIREFYHDDFTRLGYSFDPEIIFPKRKMSFVSDFSSVDNYKKYTLLSTQEKLSNGSNYLFVPNTSSKDLLIVLSTHNQYDRYFGLEKLMSSYSVNILFLTNSNNNYYSDVLENGGNLYENFLREFLRKKDFSNVTIFGSSMAGFAALKFAAVLGLNAFVTNAQVDLDLSYKYAWPDLKKTLSKVNEERDLIEALNRSRSYIYYLYGSSKIDEANANKLHRSLVDKDRFIFRQISDESHNFPFPDNLEIIESVHRHLSFIKNNRL